LPASDLVDNWPQVLTHLRERLGEDLFARWIAKTSLLDADGDGVRLCVPNSFVQARLEQDFTDEISRAVSEVLGVSLQVEYVVTEVRPKRETTSDMSQTSSSKHNATLTAGAADETGLRARPERGERARGRRGRYPLLDFVVAAENRLAYLAVRNVLTKARTAYNPLYIYGPTATGKTHLLRGLALGLRQNYPDRTIRFSTSAQFSSEYVRACREKKLDLFRRKLYGLDVLLLDDIQNLEGKRGTQRELIVAFDILHSRGALIIAAGSHLPRRLNVIDPALASRLTCGMAAGITSPGYRTRCAILKKYAEKLEFCYHATQDVFEFIAKAFPDNARELLGGLNRVEAGYRLALSGARPPKMDVEFVRSAVKELLPDRDRPVTLQGLERLVEKYFGLVRGSLRQPSRRRSITIPRQVCMYLARKHTNLSLAEICSYFRRRSPGTVKNALKRVAKMLETDPACERQILRIEDELARTSSSAVRPGND